MTPVLDETTADTNKPVLASPAKEDDPYALWDGPTAVGLYLMDRKYGGHEEGGWWFDSGPLVQDPEIYAVLGAMPATFPDHKSARTFMAGLKAGVERLNEGRPDTGHSNSRGRYELMDMPGLILSETYPAGPAPHYE